MMFLMMRLPPLFNGLEIDGMDGKNRLRLNVQKALMVQAKRKAKYGNRVRTYQELFPH